MIISCFSKTNPRTLGVRSKWLVTRTFTAPADSVFDHSGGKWIKWEWKYVVGGGRKGWGREEGRRGEKSCWWKRADNVPALSLLTSSPLDLPRNHCYHCVSSCDSLLLQRLRGGKAGQISVLNVFQMSPITRSIKEQPGRADSLCITMTEF